MESNNLEMARKEIDEALKLVEDMEEVLNSSDESKDIIKEKFSFLSKKVEDLENILKAEGIL
ncbi:hypothetical protein IAI10_11335 [Clostridium sp. 19966]|uniref:hypothetical protein n=1 Tax=Clostridium sp. 19966 TaxID=2768166 RepID=UPI0028DD80C9|nr:hypothetical protein [Clostridium sp. 19966]MDT8717251.1 hypothetical protein [Clostridium sp. 19966]